MVDGGLPYRYDYTSSAHVGTVTGATVPSNTGALLVFYRDPSGSFGTLRMAVGKNTIPGIGVTQISGDQIQSTLEVNLQLLADKLQEGWDSPESAGSHYYRYLKVPKPRTAGTPLHGTVNQQVRGYLATQKRRFVPRG
jgi:hypothetical protein